MKIHLIKHGTIRNYILQQAGSKISFEDGLTKIKMADWNVPSDITDTFSTANILGKGSYRVIFNIAGNRFRMICKYGFGETEVHLFVCWIGTHAEYNKLCREEKQYSINNY